MNYDIVLCKVNIKNWGRALNKLQNVAKKVLPKKEFKSYLVKSSRDIEESECMDGILINGQYFDWKEFDYKQKEIVCAWLNYFNESQLTKIANAL